MADRRNKMLYSITEGWNKFVELHHQQMIQSFAPSNSLLTCPLGNSERWFRYQAVGGRGFAGISPS